MGKFAREIDGFFPPSSRESFIENAIIHDGKKL
jgi:hypothetical protein